MSVILYELKVQKRRRGEGNSWHVNVCCAGAQSKASEHTLISRPRLAWICFYVLSIQTSMQCNSLKAYLEDHRDHYETLRMWEAYTEMMRPHMLYLKMHHKCKKTGCFFPKCICSLLAIVCVETYIQHGWKCVNKTIAKKCVLSIWVAWQHISQCNYFYLEHLSVWFILSLFETNSHWLDLNEYMSKVSFRSFIHSITLIAELCFGKVLFMAAETLWNAFLILQSP